MTSRSEPSSCPGCVAAERIAREIRAFNEEHIERAARCACDLRAATGMELERCLQMIAKVIYEPGKLTRERTVNAGGVRDAAGNEVDPRFLVAAKRRRWWRKGR